MTTERALKIVFALSLAGVVFSGTLTAQELFGSSALSCPAPGAPGTILGYPACVYGLVMYVAIAAIAGWGLLATKRSD
ncbi:MAG: hypothetical protein U9Q74_16495 [Gemmatimonadota bacterium]|nr:hypothetical protein [Gemmatimonadota bacterium]